MAYIHTVPIHLETEETFLFNLTGRQCLILGCGIAVGSLPFGSDTTSSLSLLSEVVLSGIIMLLAFLLALTRVAGRTLEEWALVWMLYWLQPRRLLWSFTDTPGQQESEQDEENEQKQREEELW